MPKEFDANKLGFSSGVYGSTRNSNIIYNIDGKTITGRYNGILESQEALTIRCELPDDYFLNTNNYVFTIFTSIICGISVIISFIIWFKKGKEDLVVETVEFYPPYDLNSCELQYVLEGKSSKKGVISLLLYLADKGYLKIEEIGDKGLFKKKDFKITKLKEYDGKNKIEKTFFKGLFSCSKANENYVTSSNLYDKFYKTISNIQTKTERDMEDKIYNDNKKYSSFFIISIFIIVSLMVFKILFEYPLINHITIIVMIPMILVCVAFVTLMLSALPFAEPKMPIFVGIMMIGLTLIPLYIWVKSLVYEHYIDSLRLIDTKIAIISILIIIFIGYFLSKRSNYGNELYGKTRGFKNFLKTAKKEQLESLVVKNPLYFYDILPYTYALGVSKKWVKKFETIALQAPSWINDSNDFSINSFDSFMNSTMSSVQHYMTSSPSSSSPSDVGSSSGGGSSGGGSGGGGGSSW